MKLIILYIGIGLYLLVASYVQAWLYTDYRIRVGNTKFFLHTVLALLVFVALLLMFGLEFPWSLKLLVIVLAMSANLLGSIYIYKREGKAQQKNRDARD